MSHLEAGAGCPVSAPHGSVEFFFHLFARPPVDFAPPPTAEAEFGMADRLIDIDLLFAKSAS
jgi:hypothetical protein